MQQQLWEKDKVITRLKKENEKKSAIIEKLNIQVNIEEKIKWLEAEKDKELIEQKLLFSKREFERETHYLTKWHEQALEELKYWFE